MVPDGRARLFSTQERSNRVRFVKTLTCGLVGLNLLLCRAAIAAPGLKILIDQPPATLNPRMALDASGQRINALLFAALTRVGATLSVEPELALRWSSDRQSKRWEFTLAPDSVDHSGLRLTPALLKECFENYRQSKPSALSVQNLTAWKTLSVQGNALVFELTQADPHFDRNVSLLRFFRQEGSPPCVEPKAPSPVIGSGPFRAQPMVMTPDRTLNLERRQPDGSFEPTASLLFVRDENTRTLRLLRGEADVAQNSFAPYRTRWLKKQNPERFELTEAPGVNVSYLAFNLRDPLLRDLRVRQALALSIPVDSIIRHKLAGMAERASSFLAPFLPEAIPQAQAISTTLDQASTLLDQAGYPRSKTSGIREGLPLTFKTTPIREGYEIVRIIQDSWKKLGISLKIEVVEPAVFLASVRKGAFQLSLGRWIGVADSSIFERTLRSSSPTNRAGYQSGQMDLLLDQAAQAQTLEQRKVASEKVQNLMLQELPYYPLWFWKNALLYDKKLEGLSADELSRSGGLMPLFELRPKK